ncbi:rubredoxin [Sedimentibacter sp. zth1]|uniref:rubredoxin n=1 Tax=Sedimentibacter sp. zth1 TaxID=2816908 RepID=UPI001A910AC4|nr:rubredoxin [Sedimentibacter sp. zth1]QSX04912.1 rubredoxin [Sedimentibacter sp. zth1]
MKKYVCDTCGYKYDEELGEPKSNIDTKILWEELPYDYTCPICGSGKNTFSLEK